jgi:hypothetical protein
LPGSLWVSGNDALTSLAGLEGLTYVGENVGIGGDSLSNLTGLEGLTNIGGDLTIGGGNVFTNLSGLEGLTSIGGTLRIVTNNSPMNNLTGLEGVTSIGGNLSIERSDALFSLEGLEGVISIGGWIGIDKNLSLTSLEGINNIDAATIMNLSVYDNPQLSTCEVQSICDYLASPAGNIWIDDNAPGCNSQQEVEDACASFMHEIGVVSNFEISPNPFTASTTLSYELNQPEKVWLSIYNHLGQLVYQTQENQPQGSQQLIWSAEGYAEGVYYYRLQVGDAVANGKMVKVK